MEIRSLHSNTLAPQPQGQYLTPVSLTTIYTISSCYSHKWRSLVDFTNAASRHKRWLKWSRPAHLEMTGVLEVFKTAVYLNAKQKAASLNGISPWNPSRKVTRRPYKPNQKSPWRLTLKPTKGHKKALQAHPTDKEVQTRDLIYCHKRGSSARHNDLPYSPQKRPWEGYCWPEPDWRHPPTSPWNDGTTCAEWDSFGSETRTRASPAVHAEVLCGHVWKNKNK